MRSVTHVINVQGDEPLVDPQLIDRLVRQMQRDPEIEMITAAHPFEDPDDAQSPHQVKVVLDRQRRALYFSRSADPLPARRRAARYLRHQGIYGYRRELLLRFVRWKPSPLEKAEVARAIARLGEWRKDSSARDQRRLARSRYPGRRPGDRTPASPVLREPRRERLISMKYIFVTGGVVSSLGKGLAAASLGTLLELRGLRVVLQNSIRISTSIRAR